MKKRNPSKYLLVIVGTILAFLLLSISISLSNNNTKKVDGLASFNFLNFLGFDFGDMENIGEEEVEIEIETLGKCRCSSLDLDDIWTCVEEGQNNKDTFSSNTNEKPKSTDKNYIYCKTENGCDWLEDETKEKTNCIMMQEIDISVTILEECGEAIKDEDGGAALLGGETHERGTCSEDYCKVKITEEILINLDNNRNEEKGDIIEYEDTGYCYDETLSKNKEEEGAA